MSLIIDSGCKFNLITHPDWSMLVKRKATVFTVRTHIEKQFRAYASNKLLRVMYIFEAPISVEPGTEEIASFYVIENGEQTRLKEAKFFARLDLKDAYHQLVLDESSREITTFITPRGLFRYKRLMFGVNSAPDIFNAFSSRCYLRYLTP